MIFVIFCKLDVNKCFSSQTKSVLLIGWISDGRIFDALLYYKILKTWEHNNYMLSKTVPVFLADHSIFSSSFFTIILEFSQITKQRQSVSWAYFWSQQGSLWFPWWLGWCVSDNGSWKHWSLPENLNFRCPTPSSQALESRRHIHQQHLLVHQYQLLWRSLNKLFTVKLWYGSFIHFFFK